MAVSLQNKEDTCLTLSSYILGTGGQGVDFVGQAKNPTTI